MGFTRRCRKGYRVRLAQDAAATSAGLMEEEAARSAFVRLCAAGFLAYCSYAICRTPLLPLFASELGADAPTIGFVVGASTLTGILLKLPIHADGRATGLAVGRPHCACLRADDGHSKHPMDLAVPRWW